MCNMTLDAVLSRVSRKSGESVGDAVARLCVRVDKLDRIAASGSVQSFLALPDESKALWFALLADESCRRKAAEDRVEWLESQLALRAGVEIGSGQLTGATEGDLAAAAVLHQFSPMPHAGELSSASR